MVSGTLVPLYTVLWVHVVLIGDEVLWNWFLRPVWLIPRPVWLALRPSWLVLAILEGRDGGACVYGCTDFVQETVYGTCS